jgi:hypothetical protein
MIRTLVQTARRRFRYLTIRPVPMPSFTVSSVPLLSFGTQAHPICLSAQRCPWREGCEHLTCPLRVKNSAKIPLFDHLTCPCAELHRFTCPFAKLRDPTASDLSPCGAVSPAAGARTSDLSLVRGSTPARITPYPTGRLFGVALSQALRARLRSHCPSGTFLDGL